ncbi:hypothetical protein [Snodgrassella sp. ESL0253]|uniref:hypothetical protein n=1 Tax=Snodgrassella sp. ESL0253 TaxID=2705031 RepID=UPI0015842311|nr:hypothetical protein [Snodgrassella sp. ESL0253]NUE67738.1 hypothetical protein [Snodgrassella sp. ESL0253]
MKFISPPAKIKTILLVVLGSLSAYGLAATTCTDRNGCGIGAGKALGSDVKIAAGQYQNAVPTPAEFQDGWNSSLFNIGNDFDAQNLSSIKAEFTPGTNIILDLSFWRSQVMKQIGKILVLQILISDHLLEENILLRLLFPKECSLR